MIFIFMLTIKITASQAALHVSSTLITLGTSPDSHPYYHSKVQYMYVIFHSLLNNNKLKYISKGVELNIMRDIK